MTNDEFRRRMAESEEASAQHARKWAAKWRAHADALDRRADVHDDDACRWRNAPAGTVSNPPPVDPPRPAPRKQRALTEAQRVVLSLVPLDWTMCQDIADRGGMLYSDVYPRLVALEWRGLVERQDGKFYGLTKDGERFVGVAPGVVAWRSVTAWDPLIAEELEGPERIQRKRTKGWRMPAGAVYVGRPGRWGNPFTVAGYLDVMQPTATEAEARQACVDAFRDWLRGDTWAAGSGPEWARRRADYLASIPELAGRDLACWCPPDQPCHADVLLELANQPDAREGRKATP